MRCCGHTCNSPLRTHCVCLINQQNFPRQIELLFLLYIVPQIWHLESTLCHLSLSFSSSLSLSLSFCVFRKHILKKRELFSNQQSQESGSFYLYPITKILVLTFLVILQAKSRWALPAVLMCILCALLTHHCLPALWTRHVLTIQSPAFLHSPYPQALMFRLRPLALVASYQI